MNYEQKLEICIKGLSMELGLKSGPRLGCFHLHSQKKTFGWPPNPFDPFTQMLPDEFCTVIAAVTISVEAAVAIAKSIAK